MGISLSVRVNRDDLVARLRDQIRPRLDHEAATGGEDSEAVVRAEPNAAGVLR